MAVKASFKNSFLSFEHVTKFGSKRRSRSEEVNVHEVNTDLNSHLQHLEESYGNRDLFSPKKSEDIQVFQSECRMLHKSRALGKMGPTLSNSSVSTMAPEDDDDDCESDFRKNESSNSLSTMAWGDEEDDLDFSSDNIPTQQESVAEITTHAMQQAAPKDSKHASVPKNVNLAEEYARSKKEGQVITTVMIRNIPNRCSQRELINELDSVGLAGCFDFLYIPLDLGTMSNVGYAFVNFTHPMYAARCMEVLPKHHFKRQRKVGKGVAVSAAHMQGLENNLKHYEKSAVNTSRLRQRRPVVMNILKTVSLASLI